MNIPKLAAEQKKHLGIIGCQISHSLSPIMHNTVIQTLNLPMVYGVMDVTEEMLPSLISSMRSLHFRGANVTIPYKQIIMKYLDEISEEAEKIGAVNTIVNNNGRLIGHNTDVWGVYLSLQPYANEIKNNHVIIFGAGGATKATVFAVAKFFSPRYISIVNRTAGKAHQIINHFSPQYRLTKFSHLETELDIQREIEVAALVINTTSVGMKPNIHAMPISPNIVLQKNQLVFDIVYNPVETSFLKLAKSVEARTIGGVEMLLGQGARAFELWTHQEFPMSAARAVLTQELTNPNGE